LYSTGSENAREYDTKSRRTRRLEYLASNANQLGGHRPTNTSEQTASAPVPKERLKHQILFEAGRFAPGDPIGKQLLTDPEFSRKIPLTTVLTLTSSFKLGHERGDLLVGLSWWHLSES
jgi:hypothetical protein